MTLTGPGIKPAVNQTPVSLTDLASTIESFVTGEKPDDREAWRGRPLQSFVDSPDEDRPVLSEYHDGGSPTGFFMLRQGRWKYVYYAENNPDLLFDMEADPQELRNLADLSEFATLKTRLLNILCSILDPEQVNQSAFDDQAAVIEKMGGIEAIGRMKSFNHTPIGN
jgi:choline-sulfatase